MNGLPFYCTRLQLHSKHKDLFHKYCWPPSLTTSLVIEDKVVVLVDPQHGRVGEPAGVCGKDVFKAREKLDKC